MTALIIARPANPPPIPPAKAPTFVALLPESDFELALGVEVAEVADVADDLLPTAAALSVLVPPVVVDVAEVVADELLLEVLDDWAAIGLKFTPV